MGSQGRKKSRCGGAGTQQAIREGCKAQGGADLGGRSAEGQVGRGMGGGIGRGEGGQALQAAPDRGMLTQASGRRSAPTPPMLAPAATPRHATPTPPLARVTLPLPPPPGRPGAASARKTLWGSVRLWAGGLRGPVQLQPPKAKLNASPAASSGSLGDVDGALLELPLVQPCLRTDPQSIASPFLACSSQAAHALLPPL